MSSASQGIAALRGRFAIGYCVKLPRDLSGAKVVKGLVRLGFWKEGQEGSHIKLSDGSKTITVPNHKALLPKTLQSILKQAGKTIEELLEEI